MTLAQRLDHACVCKLADNAANRGIRQLRKTGEVGLGRFSHTPQDLEHKALVVAPELYGIRSLSDKRAFVQQGVLLGWIASGTLRPDGVPTLDLTLYLFDL